jgi:hypothetical protein
MRLNHEYELNAEQEQKVTDKVTSLWLNIEQKIEGYQKKIIIAYNRKILAVFFTVVLIFLIYILINIHDYFIVVIYILLIPSQLGFFSPKICIIKNMSDNSITIQKQSILNNETIAFKNEENPILKLFRVMPAGNFALVIVSKNKKATLNPANPPFPFRVGVRYNQWRFTKKDAKNISNFLNIPLSSEIKNVSDGRDEYIDSLNREEFLFSDSPKNGWNS